MLHARGIIPALVTPFDARDSLDVGVVRRLIGFLKGTGVHGLFVVSNAGEYYCLSTEEKRMVLEASLDVAGGGLPVYFGSGAMTTREAVQLTRMAEDIGAQAVSVITPQLARISNDELYEHYRAICGCTRLPVLLYNNPAATGVSISTEVARRLAPIENLRGVKDSSGNFAQTLEYLSLGKEFQVLAGRDGLILSTLMHGGTGAISSVACAFPELALGIYNNWAKGDWEAARSCQLRMARLRQSFELGTFPSVVKKALELRGFPVGRPRAPVGELDERRTEQLKSVMHDAALPIS